MMQLICRNSVQVAARRAFGGPSPRSRSCYLRAAASMDVRAASTAGATAAPEDVPAAAAAVKPPKQKQQKQPQVGALHLQ